MKTLKQSGKVVAKIRKIIDKSQAQFAAMVGVSKHTIISVENGRNQLSPNLVKRIRIATGAQISNDKFRFEPVYSHPGSKEPNKLTAEALKFIRRRHDGTGRNHDLYTREDFEQWRANFYPSNDETARRVFDQIKVWVEYVIRAAAKPGVAGNRNRLPAVHQSLVEWLNETLENFKLFNEVEGILDAETRCEGEAGFNASSLTKPESAAELHDLKERIATYGYDFAELKKFCKKAAPGDWIMIQTESRMIWDPFTGRETIPCADWKILKKRKFWLEFGYDAMSRMTKIPAKHFFLDIPEVLEGVAKLRLKSKENAARHSDAYLKS